jgi:hypothetical protein
MYKCCFRRTNCKQPSPTARLLTYTRGEQLQRNKAQPYKALRHVSKGVIKPQVPPDVCNKAKVDLYKPAGLGKSGVPIEGERVPETLYDRSSCTGASLELCGNLCVGAALRLQRMYAKRFDSVAGSLLLVLIKV